MSTIAIDIADKSSARLFLDLAKKMHFKAKVLTETQKEEWALLSMMKERSKEPSLPMETNNLQR